MALSNVITGANTTFATGVGDWSATNATAVRDLNRSVYSNVTQYVSDTVKVREHAAKVTANSTTAPTFELDSIPVTGGVVVAASCRVASTLITSSYARLDIEFYDAVGSQTGSTSTGTALDTSTTAGTLIWQLMMNSVISPEDAVTAKVILTFGRNAAGDVITTAVSGDYWLVASPGFVSFTNFDWFTYNAHENLPSYVRDGDAGSLFLKRFMTTVFKPAAEIRELAKGMRYDRAVDGTEYIPKLADPDNMPTTYFAWLSSLLGVKLGASASSAGSNWSTLYVLADTDGGKYAHDLADGTPGDGITTWAEWYEEFGEGSETQFLWSEIAGASGGSFDGVVASRLLLKHAASGVHAGKLTTMDAFLREFVNPNYEFYLKPFEYGSPQFTKLVADSRDVTDGGLILQNFFDLISPAGTTTVVSASSTPMKESATFAFLSNYYGEAVGLFGPQGLVDEAGGAVTASLMQYPSTPSLDDAPLLGGIIAPAPLTSGAALLSGHRVSIKPDTASTVYDLGNGTSENFDIIVGLSSVTLPASGARTIASGSKWALKAESTGAVTFEWDGASHTTSATYNFDDLSKVDVQYIRINKVDTTLKVFVQDSLFSDWDNNQLGADITLASSTYGGGAVGATDFIILADADPSGDTELASLSCAVHRVLLFVASNGTAAWSESAGEYYDYGNAGLDANFANLSSSDYYSTTGITMNAVDFDITDSGGANVLTGGTANDLTIANDGTYDYVNISTQELSVYDERNEPLFVHDEFSMTVTVMDPLSTSAFELVDYAHNDVSTDFKIEFIQNSGLKLSVAFTDGTNTLSHEVDASSWSSTTTWHTVTATYSPANGLTVYVDGVQDGSDSSTDLVFVDTSQDGVSLDRSNVMIGGGAGVTGDVDCRYVAFHHFELSATQTLDLATELGTV